MFLNKYKYTSFKDIKFVMTRIEFKACKRDEVKIESAPGSLSEPLLLLFQKVENNSIYF